MNYVRERQCERLAAPLCHPLACQVPSHTICLVCHAVRWACLCPRFLSPEQRAHCCPSYCSPRTQHAWRRRRADPRRHASQIRHLAPDRAVTVRRQRVAGNVFRVSNGSAARAVPPYRQQATQAIPAALPESRGRAVQTGSVIYVGEACRGSHVMVRKGCRAGMSTMNVGSVGSSSNRPRGAAACN